MKQLTDLNERDHIAGNVTAPLVLVEFGDYECPYCGMAYPMVKNLQDQLGEDLAFVFRNFPLSRIHPHAFSAAVATEAAALQEKFWEMHDIIFEHQRTLEKEDLLGFAQTIGLDLKLFKQDIELPKLTEKVEQDFETGIRLDVNGTPAFFVNGQRYPGALEERQLLTFLKEQLVSSSTIRG
jgi:protein-disulfide isomerase